MEGTVQSEPAISTMRELAQRDGEAWNRQDAAVEIACVDVIEAAHGLTARGNTHADGFSLMRQIGASQ
jgi:hypothetical protein